MIFAHLIYIKLYNNLVKSPQLLITIKENKLNPASKCEFLQFPYDNDPLPRNNSFSL